MSAHTSGPWAVVQTGRIFDDSPSIRDADGKTVAVVPADDTMEIEDGAIVESLSPEQKANACLIAAAPLLLAELEEVRSLVESKIGSLKGRRQDAGIKFSREHFTAQLARIDAAIAKARGGR